MKVGTLLHPSWLAAALLDPSGERLFGPLVERCLASGAEHIELTGELFTMAPSSLLERIASEIREDLVPLKANHDLSFSVHLPYMGGMDLSTSIEAVRRATIETFRRIAEITSPLEPVNYVLHIAGMLQEAAGGMFTAERTEALRAYFLANAEEGLRAVLEFLSPERICLENLPGISFEIVSPLIERYGLSVCLDIGHLILRGDPLPEFLDRYGPILREVHLHDVKRLRYGPNVSVRIDHHALGEGELRFPEILRALGEAGFSGPLVLEILQEASERSIRRLTSLVHGGEAETR